MDFYLDRVFYYTLSVFLNLSVPQFSLSKQGGYKRGQIMGLCCKEQYCIGTWNVGSMKQGKLKVVKQEMAKVNIDILGISELKWTGMGEFNS